MSKGRCNFCGAAFGKSAITRHLESCRKKQARAEAPDTGLSLRKSVVLHLTVEGRYNPSYWMHLEVPADAKLKTLDGFLRDIWLECCGHLSAFDIEGIRYSVAPMSDFSEKSMRARLDAVLRPGMTFWHEYDYGSTTYLKLKVLSQEQKQIADNNIRILARNEPPEYYCDSCGKKAVKVCAVCILSGEGCLCESCSIEHKCGEDMFLPLVNSPRTGVCGYTGD